MNIKRIIGVLASITLITGTFASIGTKAFFTSSAESTSTFSTGTLILGGVIDNIDTPKKFATVNFENLEPGKPFANKVVELKNVGTLPLKIYRITGTNFKGNNKILEDPYVLVEVAFYKDKDCTQLISNSYRGMLSQLVESNGGFFNPVLDVPPSPSSGSSVFMKVQVEVNEFADNDFQNVSGQCDLNVFAQQANEPNQGANNATVAFTGPKDDDTLNFNVTGYADNKYLNFRYDWDKWEYEIPIIGTDIAGKTGLYDINIHGYDVNNNISSQGINIRITVNDHNIANANVGFCDNNGKVLSIDKSKVQVNLKDNTIKIDKSIFPEEWKVVNIQFGGLNINKKNAYDYANKVMGDLAKGKVGSYNDLEATLIKDFKEMFKYTDFQQMDLNR